MAAVPGAAFGADAHLRFSYALTEDEIREGIQGNLCRCTGYVNIVKSIQQAADAMRTAEAPAEPATAG